MATHDDTFETGMYYDRTSAETTVQRLEDLGYSRDDISVMMNDKTREKEFANQTGTKAAEGAVTGAAVGGALGGLLAGLTATGSVIAIGATGGAATPLVIGPLAAALAGLGAGGVTGGIIGALVGAGIPEDKAKEYSEGLDRGGILLGVRPRTDTRDQVRSIFTPATTETGSIDYAPNNKTFDRSL
ncbi:MAG: general stress protein [Candidatus Eremiobacteraeota bacterium]|nr:general stress protein [Candidatus Eremiobacteraeota bacterium]